MPHPFFLPAFVMLVRRPMGWLTFYLAGYFMLLGGAAWALWHSGILAQIPGVWIAVASLVAVWPALMLAVVSRRPASPTRS